MKKLLMLSAAVLAFQAAPALAERGESHKGKMFESKDTNGDGTISESEFLAHAKEKFSKMDKDGDGSISKEEAKENWEGKRAEMKEKRKEWREKHPEMKKEMDATETKM